MIEQFAAWLGDTPVSHLFADHIWTIVITQTIHIMSIAAITLAAVLLNLRVMGIAGRNQSVSAMAAHHVPWIWTALVILLITGTILTIAEPTRELVNSTFQIKLIMILVVVGITHHYAKMLRKDAHYWDPDGGHHGLGMLLGSVSLFLWLGIIVCGRLIAYVGSG